MIFKITARHHIFSGLFLISAATLILELLISRVMSAVVWYHFAFMAICFAILGMAVGAVLVQLNLKYWQQRVPFWLAFSCGLFAAAVLLNLMIVINKPVFYNLADAGWEFKYSFENMVLVFSSTALPFLFSGICLALIFAVMPAEAHKIYFWNLLASGLGCLIFIPLMNVLGPVNGYVLLSLMGLLAGLCFLLGQKAEGRSFQVLVSLLCVGILFFITQLREPFLALKWVKGQPSRNFYQKWNAYSYLRLSGWEVAAPFGWGWAPQKTQELSRMQIPQAHLDIDGGAGTVMTAFDGNLKKIGFLKYDVTALPHYFVQNGDVLVVGVGAGRDILTALAFEQKSVVGVEINDGILFLLNEVAGNFSGHLDRHPRVTLIRDEARSFISAAARSFDLIQISLIDTFAVSLTGAYALTENGLYTVEAFVEYLNHLTSAGYLSVSYWFNAQQPEFLLKLTATAAQALEKMGAARPREHLLIAHREPDAQSNGVATLLVKKSRVTAEEEQVLKTKIQELGFRLVLSPSESAYPELAALTSVPERQVLIQEHPRNIAPATDDRPFFFLLSKMSPWGLLKNTGPEILSAEAILYVLLGVISFVTFWIIGVPFFRVLTVQGLPRKTGLGLAIYFSATGLAFMLIEMSQLTRWGMFLGHPVYGLAVVLFAFLVSSGLGSYVLGRVTSPRRLFSIFFLFIAGCFMYDVFVPGALASLSRAGLLLRIATVIALIIPLGFCMGSFLPQGIRLLTLNHKETIAIFWALNAAMSVIGSILSMIFVTHFGIGFTFLLGVGLYLCAGSVLGCCFSKYFSRRGAVST